MTEESKDFSQEFDLAKAEESGRNLASIITAFRQELMDDRMPESVVDDLTTAFGTAIIAKLMLMSNEALDEESEEA